MQEDFEELADELNEIVESTEYNGNKLFTAAGETISVSLGNGSSLDIFAKDLSLDVEGLDLTTGAEAALTHIQSVIKDVSEYSEFLGRQTTHLENATSVIEFELAGAMGVDASDFDMNFASQVASYAAEMTVEEMSAFFDAQANMTSTAAARLLEITAQNPHYNTRDDTD